MTPIVIALLFTLVSHAEPTSYAVFRSTDAGNTWTRSSAGLPTNVRINAFVSNSAIVFAATDRGIYTSADQGHTWTTGPGTVSHRILSLARIGNQIYAGADTGVILTSRDHGASWTAHANLPFRKVRSLLAYNGSLYVGTDAQGVFVSTTEGRSWTARNQGLPPGAQIFALAANRGALFAGLYSKGLYTLDPHTSSWRKVANVAPLVLTATGSELIAGHNPGGIFHSADNGLSWTHAAIPPSPTLGNAPVWEAAATSKLALAGVAAGVYHSIDQGRSWTPAAAGLPNGSAGIAFHIMDGYLLAAVSYR